MQYNGLDQFIASEFFLCFAIMKNCNIDTRKEYKRNYAKGFSNHKKSFHYIKI